MKKTLFIFILLLGSTAWLQAQKTFTGDVFIRSLESMEEFIEAGYTRVDGNLTVDQGTQNFAGDPGVLEAYPDGLNKLREVTGDFTLKRGFLAAPPLRIARLERVGGALVIDDFDDVSMPQLRTIGDKLEVIEFVTMDQLSFPKLTSVGGDFILNRPPVFTRFPRLREIGGDIDIDGFDTGGTESISFPQLTQVNGDITIGGPTDNSGDFKQLALPRLKTVTGDINVKFTWVFFEKQTWASLERAASINIVGGAFLDAPGLKEVNGDFKHLVRTLLTAQTMQLDYPALENLRGEFTYEAPGINDERITLSQVSAPKLNYAQKINFIPQAYLIENVELTGLTEAKSVTLRSVEVDLSTLKRVEQIKLTTSPELSLSLPLLEQIEDISINTPDNESIARIAAAKLKSARIISTNARALAYPSLENFRTPTSLGFDKDLTEVDFSSLQSLESLWFSGGSFSQANFSSLTDLDQLIIENIQKLELTTGNLNLDKLNLTDIPANASFSWQISGLKSKNINISGLNLKSFTLPIEESGDVFLSNSDANSLILGSLTKVNDLSISSSSFSGTLNLSKLTTANNLSISFAEPTSLNLSGLVALGDFGSDTNRLSFGQVTDLNLSSLLQLSKLEIHNDLLTSVDLSSLKLAKDLSFDSEPLAAVSLNALEVAESVSIKSKALKGLGLNSLIKAKQLVLDITSLETINLTDLKEISSLKFDNLALSTLDLSALTAASAITLNAMPELTNIDLSKLPELIEITLKNLPKLASIETFKPGEQFGLKGQLTAADLLEEEASVTCANGESRNITYFPAVRVVELDCEGFEIEPDVYSTRPRTVEDFMLIGGSGSGYSFEEDISFSALQVSADELNFGVLDEDTPTASRSFKLTNSGQATISGTIALSGIHASEFGLSASNFSLETGENVTIDVVFGAALVGNYEASVTVETETPFEISLEAEKEGCVEIGGICITANSVVQEADGVFKMNGNVTMNSFLKFSGEVTVNTNDNSIAGNGEISVNAIFEGQSTLYSGEFSLSLADEANKRFATSLEDSANQLLRLANLPITMGNLQFIENGIQMSASMTLPPQLKNTKVELDTIMFTTTEGLDVIGSITVPGKISLGGVSTLKDLGFTFNTAENEFSGSGTLGTKLFDISGTVVMKSGGLDEVKVVIVPARPIPLGPSGWSVTQGSGEILKLQSPPSTLRLSADLAPTATAGFDLVSLNNLTLSYTFGRKLQGSGELRVFDEPIAKANMEVNSRSVFIEGELDVGGFLIGNASLGVENATDGIRVRGFLEAKLQIPNRDSFFYQVFDGTVGLPYTVASTKASLYNTQLIGETSVLGFQVAYGVAFINNDFEFDLAKSRSLLNQELFGDTGGGIINPDNSLGRFEGQSLRYKPGQPTGGMSSDNAEQTEQSFTISRDLKDIFIRVQHESVMPEYTVTLPDGTLIDADKAQANGVLYVQSETSTKQTFFAFKQPAKGSWTINILSEDVEYSIDVAGADPEASLSFGTLQRDGNSLTIPWTLDEVNEDYEINLLYDTNDQGENGSEVVTSLPFNSTKYSWDLSALPTGEYSVYAELVNTVTDVVKIVYAAEPFTIVADGAPAAPQNLTAANEDVAIALAWDAVDNATEYTIYYERDRMPDFNSPGLQTDQADVVMNELDPGHQYFFAVAAWNADGVQGPRSEAISLDFISETANNAPSIAPVADATIIAGQAYTQTLAASDPDGDDLTLSLLDGPANLSLTGNEISWTPGLDQLGPHSIDLEVADSFGNTDELSYSLLVVAPNDPPTDITLSASTLPENSAVGTPVGSLTAVDEDADDTHSFELVSGEDDDDNAKFTINGSQVLASAVFDFETQTEASIRIKATDGAGQSIEKAFTIGIENVNEAPASLSLSNAELAENLQVGTVVGTLSTDDPDADDSHTYALISGQGDTDNAAFTVENNELRSGEVFDFETQASYSIRLSVTDAGGLNAEQTFTISITDGPDPAIELSTTSLTFEPTALGLSSTMSFTIRNTGDGTLEVTGITAPAGFMASANTVTIAAGAEREVTVTFSPTENRMYQGDLEVASNAGNLSITLSGEGAIITSIDQNQLRKEDIRLYPNPVSDRLTVDLSKLNGAEATIQVFDRNGKGTLQLLPTREQEVIISTRPWPAGLYLLSITTAKGRITQPIIVKK